MVVAPVGRSAGELRFTSEQRARLGIEDHESVRVLSAGCRTILLERGGGSVNDAFPWDRDLVLTADVRAFPLADVLNLVHATAKSGFLFFEHRDHAKSVYFHRGEVVFAASNQTVDRLGEVLLRFGVITAEQHRSAKRDFAPPNKFGKILVEREILTPRELWNAVKSQIEEIVRSLFAYGAGTVFLWEGEVRPDNVVRLSLPTRRLIAEGLRRRDELLKFLAELEGPRVSLVPVDAADLSGTERTVFDALGAESSFAAVCRRAGLDPLSAARTIQLLCLAGAARLTRGKAPDGALGESELRVGDSDAVRECVLLHVKLLAELAAPIVAVEGGEGIRQRLTTIIEDGSRRFPEILEGLRVGPHGTLDPEQLSERALRVTGEREREVRLALGELVSYLEFELMNHPKLSEPEQFLEGIESLRASL
jgi:hypothetical protein